MARMKGTIRTSFMCKKCAKEYSHFLGQKLPGWSGETIRPEDIAKTDFRAILIEADEHMKKWVAENDSR